MADKNNAGIKIEHAYFIFFIYGNRLADDVEKGKQGNVIKILNMSPVK